MKEKFRYIDKWTKKSRIYVFWVTEERIEKIVEKQYSKKEWLRVFQNWRKTNIHRKKIRVKTEKDK